MPRYALYALLIFTPLARASVQDWAVTVIHMVTLIALTAFLLERCLSRDWEWIRTPLDMPIICLLAVCLLSSIFSLYKAASLWAFILLVNYVLIYYLVIQAIRTRAQFMHLVHLIIGIAAFLAIFGLAKSSGTNPFPWWDYPELHEDAFRVAATFGNANNFAGYMEMVILLTLGLLLTGLKVPRIIMMLCLIFLFIAALIFSFSRGGWIAALFGFAFLVTALIANRRFNRKKLVAGITFGFVAISLFVLANTGVADRVVTLKQKQDITNFIGRATAWAGIVDMIRDYPVLGIGPGTFAVVFTQYQPPGLSARHFRAHNDYLQVISEGGLLLIPIIIWMIIALYRKGFRKLRNPSRLVRGITVGALSGITAILIHSLGDFNLQIPADALLFTVLVALIASPLPIDNQ
ncbi:MAG: O-antigen ligase family protein [Desulfobacterales bacterium]|nr:O-antigen ligase family protein [Desulfobacterales bacterium]